MSPGCCAEGSSGGKVAASELQVLGRRWVCGCAGVCVVHALEHFGMEAAAPAGLPACPILDYSRVQELHVLN